MATSRRTPSAACVPLLAFLLLVACGRGDAPTPPSGPDADFAARRAQDAALLDEEGRLQTDAPEEAVQALRALAQATAVAEDLAALTVDYPQDESVFPPEFVPPTFLWHDDTGATTWLLRIDFTDGSGGLTMRVPGDPPPRGRVDPDALGPTNEPWEGTEYQRSARSWTPSKEVWTAIKERSVERMATFTFVGLDADARPLSRGAVRILTSKDPVGAPIFYRDVPLMPSAGESGRIKPLGDKAIPLIAWRLRDVSRPESKLVLKGMSSCGNCHSFSTDGKMLGMDVDGPSGDKGMYAVKPVSKKMVIDYDDVITWNSFQDKPENHRTIGFLSRISPDGNTVISTVNESLYTANFTDYRILQVFYPTRGILAYYSRAEGRIRALPGADDPDYVHCGAVWSPDGKELIFMRAPARDPYEDGRPLAKYPNDPNELPMRYDLYRIPFNDGKGGEAVPVEGASNNGMSNTFAKVSPDGKWIVFVKCKNGLLLRPDSRLWIVPYEGGEAREMRCNLSLMNSWHSFSPNGRWMVFSSKANRPYTQAFLTHIDEEGNDSPAILIPNNTASNRAVNLPEFLNAPYDALDSIHVPAVDHHTHFLRAETLLKEGRFPEALSSLERAIEADDEFARAHVAMGFALTQMQRYPEAAWHFERALEIDPAHPVAAFNLALAYVDLGRPAQALATLEHLEAVTPDYGGIPVARKRATEQMEMVRAQIAELQKALETNPRNGRGHQQIAGLYESVGDTELAMKHLARAVDLMPRDPVPTAGLAWLLATNEDQHLRDGPRAVTLAERAVELAGEGVAQPLDTLAAAYAEVGRYEEAVETAERALALAKTTSATLASDIERRLARYRTGHPHRVP